MTTFDIRLALQAFVRAATAVRAEASAPQFLENGLDAVTLPVEHDQPTASAALAYAAAFANLTAQQADPLGHPALIEVTYDARGSAVLTYGSGRTGVRLLLRRDAVWVVFDVDVVLRRDGEAVAVEVVRTSYFHRDRFEQYAPWRTLLVEAAESVSLREAALAR